MKKKTRPVIWLLFIIIPIVVVFVSIGLGRFFIPLDEIAKTFYYKFFPSADANSIYDTIIYRVRIPRIIAALLVGGML